MVFQPKGSLKDARMQKEGALVSLHSKYRQSFIVSNKSRWIDKNVDLENPEHVQYLLDTITDYDMAINSDIKGEEDADDNAVLLNLSDVGSAFKSFLSSKASSDLEDEEEELFENI
ncbi:hypothetical protein QE152_g35159 [Popillia japonica]|uniref:Uncharacterized protein n=1 Tax=Popillia japonica TaxID=7064 RepID=A0AAW1IRZ8_POPJA